MPLAAELYYSGSGAVDFHNRVRCQDVYTERGIKTKRWDARTNIGILAMLFTDAWMVYRAARSPSLDMSASEFFEKLAESLIDSNNIKQPKKPHPKQHSFNAKDNVLPPGPDLHRPTKRYRSGKPKQLKQNNCSVCKMSCTYVCHVCSHYKVNETFICKVSTGCLCWQTHCKLEH